MNLEKKSEIFQEIVYACKYLYSHSEIAKEARKYLSGRISKAAQEKYDFGYFPNNEHINDFFSACALDKNHLKKMSFIWEQNVSFAKKYTGHFNNHNLVMPFRDEQGRIVSLLGRSLLSEEKRKDLSIDKYIYSKGTSKGLFVYGLDKAKQAVIEQDFIICVEGQFDCIALQEAGFLNSVALGWANMTVFQMFHVLKYTKNILLILDNDNAGKSGTSKIINKYKNYNINLKTLDLFGDCKDMDEYLKVSKNVDIFKNRLKEIYGSR